MRRFSIIYYIAIIDPIRRLLDGNSNGYYHLQAKIQNINDNNSWGDVNISYTNIILYLWNVVTTIITMKLYYNIIRVYRIENFTYIPNLLNNWNIK